MDQVSIDFSLLELPHIKKPLQTSGCTVASLETSACTKGALMLSESGQGRNLALHSSPLSKDGCQAARPALSDAQCGYSEGSYGQDSHLALVS